MKGTIKWYKKEKGYGFITGEDEKDYFVHYTALPENAENVDGQNVEFEVKKTERGVQAIEIKFVGGVASTQKKDKKKVA